MCNFGWARARSSKTSTDTQVASSKRPNWCEAFCCWAGLNRPIISMSFIFLFADTAMYGQNLVFQAPHLVCWKLHAIAKTETIKTPTCLRAFIYSSSLDVVASQRVSAFSHREQLQLAHSFHRSDDRQRASSDQRL